MPLPRSAAPALVSAALVALLVPRVALAQTQPPRPSVWDGVYAADQAARGKQAYDAACAACHGADLKGVRDNRPLVGDRFWQDWGEDSLGTMFSVVRRTMPRTAPASLPEQSYLDIVAYVLQQNGYPQGTSELTEAAVNDIWVMRKEGPGPVPNFSMVWVVACLSQEPDKTWVLTRTSEPVKTRNPAASEGADLDRVKDAPLGADTFGLLDLSSKYTAHAGQKVEAKGLLIRGPRSKLNLTSVLPLGSTCPQ